MLNVTNVETLVKELWNEGRTFVPFDHSLVLEHRELYEQFLQRRDKSKDHGKWSFTHPHEHESDVGLILPRPGKDQKFSFHYNHYFQHCQYRYLRKVSKDDTYFLRVSYYLYAEAASLVSMICVEMDKQFGLDTLSSFRESIVDFPAYSISTLRSLYYSDKVGKDVSKPHVDRDFITTQFGGKYGKLLQLEGKDDDRGVDISPQPGEAVVFFGVKSLWATHGKKGPMWHCATTDNGKSRSATVFFGHIDVPDYKVVDAGEAYQYYCDHNAENT